MCMMMILFTIVVIHGHVYFRWNNVCLNVFRMILVLIATTL